MDSKGIKILIEKYDHGETTPEEERMLRDYFCTTNDDGPDAHYFRALDEERNVMIKVRGADFEEPVEKAWQKETRRRFTQKVQWASGIAAAIVITILFVFMPAKKQQHTLADTFKTPEKARMETERVLLFISARMNRQTIKLEHLSAMNQSLKKTNKLEKINESINHLRNESD